MIAPRLCGSSMPSHSTRKGRFAAACRQREQVFELGVPDAGGAQGHALVLGRAAEFLQLASRHALDDRPGRARQRRIVPGRARASRLSASSRVSAPLPLRSTSVTGFLPQTRPVSRSAGLSLIFSGLGSYFCAIRFPPAPLWGPRRIPRDVCPNFSSPQQGPDIQIQYTTQSAPACHPQPQRQKYRFFPARPTLPRALLRGLYRA